MHPELTNLVAGSRRRVEQLRLAHARLSGVRESAQGRDKKLTVRVGHAKARLAMGDDVNGTLEGLQNRAHQRAVGAFERLLSAILTDVLPGKGQVRLELGTERGAPALDVLIDNNGDLENALDGSGGAVTNVLSAGLRFAALSRTDNRKLMVLDEPDCWLKPERVPAFIRVLAAVAEKARTQTILISHHEPSTFEGLVNIVRLVKAGNGVEAQIMEPHSGAMWLDDEEPGVRSIRLINFRAHADTTLPLFPGVTALIGDNDLGKSTLAVSALRAVAYGESDDTLIRHGATEARVQIQLERGRMIEWVRRAKGNPRVTFALHENGEPVREGRPASRGQVPEWVTEALGIARVDDLDIQVGSQKAPVFLLNETASTRARLLSVGRESGRLHALIDAYADLKRKDREQVREGEIEIGTLRARIEASATLPSLTEPLDALATKAAEVESFSARQGQLAKFLARVETIETRKAACEVRAKALDVLPALPVLERTERLTTLIGSLERAQKTVAARRDLPTVALPKIAETARLAQLITGIERAGQVASLRRSFPAPVLPTITDNRRLIQLGRRMAELTRRYSLAEKLPALPVRPEGADLTGLSRAITRLSTHNRVRTNLEQEVANATAAAEEARDELNNLIEAMGGVCPVCDGELRHVAGEPAHTHG